MWWRDIVGAADLGSIVTAVGWLAVAVLTAAEKFAPHGKKPWSALARALGSEMTRDMREHMEVLDKRLTMLSDKLDEVKASGEEMRAEDARARILRFGDEIGRGIKHSKDTYDQALMDINAYDAYCDAHPHFRNHVTRTTSDFIMAQYRERLEKHDFTY